MRTMLIFLFAAGCSSYDPKLGDSPFLCGADEPRCPEGYTCGGGSPAVCLAKGITIDSGTTNNQCADDSNFEGPTRNDDIQHAFQTPVATQRMSMTIGPAAICPEGDRDTYAVQITVEKQNLETITTWDAGMPVSVSILNAGGMSLADSMAMGDKSMRAYVPNLPMGTYFVQTYAATGVKNNYSVAINVTGP